MTAPALAPVPLSEGLWAIEGAHLCWRLGVPMPLRTVVARVGGGGLWVHAPGPLTPDLIAWLEQQGRVAHLVLPGAPLLPWLQDWQTAFPEARLWPRDGLSEAPWRREIRPLTLRHGEACEHVFCHLPSRSAILSRLVIAVDTATLPPWARPLVWLAGIDDSDGKPPPGLAARLGGRKALGDLVDQVLDWGPERLILTHGRIYARDGAGELSHAMRRIMRDRLWDRALTEAKRR
ncbi:MAG: DUF4336 domain-containing protein [Roseovarius sp.]|nr:DUF4336 domain-containing protein [Roseovarius sp.]